jgi:Na+-transporting methylmalonyl-CoA/oxaloacetate decarboxylase gamma subunit
MEIAKISFDLSAIDGFAITVTVVGYGIVFIALVFMYFVYTLMPKVISMNIRQKLRKEGKHKEADEKTLDISGEVNAAISMALHLFFNEMHDEESNVMTIKKVSKRYSPWSSKIYGLNTYNRN